MQCHGYGHSVRRAQISHHLTSIDPIRTYQTRGALCGWSLGWCAGWGIGGRIRWRRGRTVGPATTTHTARLISCHGFCFGSLITELCTIGGFCVPLAIIAKEILEKVPVRVSQVSAPIARVMSIPNDNLLHVTQRIDEHLPRVHCHTEAELLTCICDPAYPK